MKRFDTLDALRGAAALLVVVRHNQDFWGPVNFQHSYLAVDFFFLLSGFVVCHAYEAPLQTTMTVKQFVQIRLLRLYPLYLIAGVACIALLAVGAFDLHFGAPVTLALVGMSLIMAPFPGSQGLFPLNPPTWSLFLEIVGNVAYAVLAKHLTTQRLYAAIAVSAAILFPAAFLTHRDGIDAGFVLNTVPLGLLRFVFSFSIGIVLYRKFKARPFAPRTNSALAVAVMLTLILILAAPTFDRASGKVFGIFCLVALFPALLWLAAQVEPRGPALWIFQKLGLASYPIYILQVPTGLALKRVLTHAGVKPENLAPWIGLAFLIALLLLCVWVGDHVDKPLRRHLGQWLLKRAGRDHS